MNKSILLKKKVIQQFTIMFLVIAVFAFLGSCTITETVIEEPSWKLVEELDGANKIILNSYVTTDSLYYYISTHSEFWKCNHIKSNPIFCYNYWPCITQTLEYKPIIYDLVSAYISEDKTEIQLALNEIDSWNIIPEYISIWDIDSTFSDNARLAMSSFTQPVGAFNNQNQFLTVVMGNSGVNFCLIDYTFDDTNSGIKITSMQKNYYLYGCWPYNDIISFDSRFFVALCTVPYLVYPNGDTVAIEDIPWSCLEFFTFNDTLYAFTSNFQIYITYDSGENWELFGQLSTWVSCFEIAGKLCCHRDDDIHEINFNTGEVKELDNWGLEGNEITSINEFNGKVYITTLSGIFYRNVDEFFTYKEDDGKEKGKLTFEKNKRI